MAFTVHNDGLGTSHNLFRVVGTAFPTEDFALTWQVFYITDRAGQFQTPFSYGPVSFTGGDDYQVAFDGNGAVSDNFAIGSHGNDSYDEWAAGASHDDLSIEGGAGFGPTTGRWYQQAYRRRKRGPNDYEQFFWFDLGQKLNKVSRDHAVALTWAAGHVFMVANDPWVSNGEEGIDGSMRAIKAWSSSAPSENDLRLESAYSSIIVPANNGSLWGQWPCVSDGNDISGNARHLSTAGTVTFDGIDILPPSVFRPARFYAPNVRRG